MAEIDELIKLLIEKMKQPITNINDVSRDKSVFQKQEIMNLVGYCNKNREIIDVVLNQISSELNNMPTFNCCLCSFICGTLVEWGGRPSIAFEKVMKILSACIHNAYSYYMLLNEKPPEDIAKYNFDIYQGWMGIDFVILPSMTMLCRDSSLRHLLRKKEGEMEIKVQAEVLMDRVPNLYYISRMFTLSDDVNIILIHPRLKVGFEVYLSGVQNNFHFFTLLQNEFNEKNLWGRLDISNYNNHSHAIRIAKNQQVMVANESITDEAVFDLFIWTAINDRGMIPSEFPLNSWVPGELLPRDIPEIGGTKVVFFETKRMAGREWDVNFFQSFHEALLPEVSSEYSKRTFVRGN
ncbi:MAG TPA: hypothetical protein VIO64_05290 [Pseudobacteroides sp.]|uniref:hypothetical protein n=1 Tax=Pseudobacteroides sp. TaxID=1968840 RepID=UPI002F958BDD